MPEDEKVVLIDDDLWDQLITLTDGEVALCFQCGVCTAICPWGAVREHPLTVRTLIRQAQLGLQGENGNLWLCTTCAQCEALCPRGVDITRVMRALRTIAWQSRETQEGLPSLLWSIFWNNNPWGQPPSQRSAWSTGLGIPAFDAELHEVLLYVGCTSSYDQRAQKIAVALARVLESAGVQFGILGDEEPCCGEAVLSVGHSAYFEELTAETSQVFIRNGIEHLVTVSPHCYDVFLNHYPDLPVELTVQHYTQYLSSLLDEGRLHFNKDIDLQVTYQDPCYLGRIAGEYAAPRGILAAIPGIELREMELSGEESLCCGGGGGRMWLETPIGERFSDLRIQQARDTGSDLLATACPFCVTCLEDSLKTQPTSRMEVLDIAEIASRAL